ncbi:serine protease [Streptomyces sp. NBC_00344]|uniref:serine protease n=1 Tax=Streptomyces sp. NBC_00344 TaxID=2975720 RepID=UPI002E1E3D91
MGSGETLVGICDRAGRLRGTGFVADDLGTVVTSHQAVDGLTGAVLHAPGERTWIAGADAITALPHLGLALVRTDGLGVRPLPISPRSRVETGTYVRVAAPGWRAARVLGESPATYTAADGSHRLDAALELAMGTDCRDALRLGGAAVGGPVIDATSGAVLGVLGTALHCAHPAPGLAVPLRGAELAPLLSRNAATVPGHGPDLNLAGVLELTALSVGLSGGPAPLHEMAERRHIVRQLADFTSGNVPVTGLVGDPGTGRTTELRALAARRAHGPQPAPTVWLRGADLRADDASVADAVARAVRRAGRIVGAAGMDRVTPERMARLAADAGQPLLVLLDGPEEMPPPLASVLPVWTRETAGWLTSHGVRMIVGCLPEFWDRVSGLPPRRAPHISVGDLLPHEALTARRSHGIPEGVAAPQDAAHPLSLRMLAEVRAALPGGTDGHPSREDILTAYLDLLCLRIAVRIAAARSPASRGTVVRRLAARVSGQVHEAARRCLGTAQGELTRASFEEVFPWRTGWASAVLAEGLLTPAGAGFRFAHSELADWVQGAHLDVDRALDPLVHGWPGDRAAAAVRELPRCATAAVVPRTTPVAGSGCPPAVPRHRIGPTVQAMLLLERRHGSCALGRRLRVLITALDRLQQEQPSGALAASRDAQGWVARLLGDVLLRVPDPRRHIGVLELLADRITLHSLRSGGPHRLGGFDRFDSSFWERLRIGEGPRLDLLRRLVPADGAPGAQSGDRYLDAVARRLAADPRSVQPLLCRWFADERPLPHGPHTELRPTVAGVAQALLYTRRELAVDDLAEALVATAHPRADELLTALAEDEPAALCRAVDRWSHDDRPGRRAAAAAHILPTAARAAGAADREQLGYAALALLTHPDDAALHGPALALLVGDARTRAHHLPRALRLFTTGHPQLPAAALAPALHTHPDPVFAAFRTRIEDRPQDAEEILRALSGAGTPELARRAAAFVRAFADRHPEGAAHAADFVGRRLEAGPAARADLLPLVTGLVRGRPRRMRSALAPVLAAPGSRSSQPLRDELLDMLLEYERYEPGHEAPGDLSVAEVLLRAAALGSGHRAEFRTRDLVHRTGLLLVRTPDGAARFDRRLVELCREVPGFAGQILGWLSMAPQEWAVVVGPSARRMVEKLGAPMPMQASGAGHGSLRPA